MYTAKKNRKMTGNQPSAWQKLCPSGLFRNILFYLNARARDTSLAVCLKFGRMLEHKSDVGMIQKSRNFLHSVSDEPEFKWKNATLKLLNFCDRLANICIAKTKQTKKSSTAIERASSRQMTRSCYLLDDRVGCTDLL